MASRDADVTFSGARRAGSIETALTQLFTDAPKLHAAGDVLLSWGIQQSFLWRLAAFESDCRFALHRNLKA